MKMILLQDVKSVGKKGDLVNVSEGYAKNFLLPRKLAVEATKSNLNDYDLKQKAEAKRKQEELEKAREKLQEYMMERKTHEKLKENAFEVFKQEINREESKEVDELTSYVYGKRIIDGEGT